MGATMTTASSVLKNLYIGPIRNQVNVSSPIWFRLKKSTKDVTGKKVIMPLRTGLSEGAGFRAAGAVLPTARNVTYAEIAADLKYLYGVMRVEGQVIKATANDAGAFMRIMDAESQGVKDVLSLDLNRSIHGRARGDLGTCGVTTATQPVQLAATANMKNFRVGMVVDIVTATTGVAISNGDSVAITAVSEANKTITTDGGNVTTSALHIVVREDSYNKELTGLSDILCTAAEDRDIYGIDTSATQNWLANVNAAATGGKFNIEDMQDLLDSCEENSGVQPTALFSRANLRKKYFLILTGDRRYIATQPEKVLDGGFKALEYSSGAAAIPWIVDRFTPLGYVRGLHEPHLEFKNMPGALMDLIEIDGEVWLPEIMGASGTDTYKAVIFSYLELIASHRNSHIELRGCETA